MTQSNSGAQRDSDAKPRTQWSAPSVLQAVAERLKRPTVPQRLRRVFPLPILLALALQPVCADVLEQDANEFKPLPYYPRQAAIDCIEGQVLVRFTVSENFEPTNIEILRSDPPGVFDDGVIEALALWVVHAEQGTEVEELFDFDWECNGGADGRGGSGN